MKRPGSSGLILLLLAVSALLLHACMDEASDDSTLSSLKNPGHYQLTIQDSGSTRGGTVTSNRGGLLCLFTPLLGAITPTGTCSVRFKTGSVVILTAKPSGGAILKAWTGCAPASENPLSCQVTMNRDAIVKVTFAVPPNSHLLSVTGGAGGSGTVVSAPAGITCTISSGIAANSGCSGSFPAGQAVLLKATAAAGSYLKAWAGAACETGGTGIGGSSGTCSVPLTDSRTVVVSLERKSVQAQLGSWSAPMTWPVVGIHAHLLPNGRVLTFGRTGHDPAVWDPVTGVLVSTARPADFFCSGHTLLPDGRLLVAGGHAGADNFGLKTTYFFDYATNSWTRGSDMRNGRWYPTNTTLPSGEVLTVSGGDTAAAMNLIPEVWQSDGSWRSLTGASINLAYYSMMFVAPDGRVFAAGPARGTRFFTTSGTGTLTVGPSSNFGSRDYGSAVMYDSGKILIVGGNTTPTATAEVIDLNAGGGASWRPVGSMAIGRRQLNATILADGKVLATGGTNAPGFNSAPTDSRVMAAELWNPATEQWTTLARMSHQRVYHSSALLLPDGRVLSVGSGEPAATTLSDDYTAELFSPPYLFKPDGTPATRPTIASVPLSISYGQSFSVQSPEAASITRITWIRLGSVTHSFNQNQRLNTLSFTHSGATGLSVSPPGNNRLAPPGHYLLFLINSAGVPSVGKIVRIQ